MTHYKMSDVAVEVNDRENNPASSKYDRFVGLEHYVSGEVIIRNYGSTENLESTMKIFQSGDVLVARRNVYLKRASMVDFDGLTSGDSIVLRAKNPVIGRILPFVLNTDAFWDFADQYSDGTMSKRLSPKTLMTYEFDLPDEDELEKFADLLWAANDTRESYQALLRQTDELVKSQFIELF
ncbi:MAG: restriction endonuclease subunit S, partial [Clostridia bacterium]|nr:restriction endonuclease subunit S [Clostridia bacterium]